MPAGLGPIRADAPASVLFCQHILQHGLVEAQIGNQFLQPEILFLRLPHVFQLRRINPAVFLAVTFRRRQHEISKVDRTVFSDVGVASENGIYGHSRFCNTDFDDKLACL
ncbi:hypothetical protein U4L99_24695, partial [Klebsiella pneumoniae]|nr:hypothetical protein [Klebsiella pneumoniae]